MAGSLETARAVYPPLTGLAVSQSWAGLEAFTPDEVPVIGPVPGIAGLLIATGFSGHGFALSPMIGDILARLALGSGLAFRHLHAASETRSVRRVGL